MVSRDQRGWNSCRDRDRGFSPGVSAPMTSLGGALSGSRQTAATLRPPEREVIMSESTHPSMDELLDLRPVEGNRRMQAELLGGGRRDERKVPGTDNTGAKRRG